MEMGWWLGRRELGGLSEDEGTFGEYAVRFTAAG